VRDLVRVDCVLQCVGHMFLFDDGGESLWVVVVIKGRVFGYELRIGWSCIFC